VNNSSWQWNIFSLKSHSFLFGHKVEQTQQERYSIILFILCPLSDSHSCLKQSILAGFFSQYLWSCSTRKHQWAIWKLGDSHSLHCYRIYIVYYLSNVFFSSYQLYALYFDTIAIEFFSFKVSRSFTSLKTCFTHPSTIQHVPKYSDRLVKVEDNSKLSSYYIYKWQY
jgi:hypothetical protein